MIDFPSGLRPYCQEEETMFSVPEPALALNDSPLLKGQIQMSRTIRVRKDDSRANIIGAIATTAESSPDGFLKSLVLNSHGAPGNLIMGEGFWKPHTAMFATLKDKVGTIWITACQIASRVPYKRTEMPGWVHGESGDGFDFCRQIAMRANCHVVAPMNFQDVPHQKIPVGSIDSFEGMVLCFKPSGELAWTHKYALHNAE
jgi:hypothetical protein